MSKKKRPDVFSENMTSSTREVRRRARWLTVALCASFSGDAIDVVRIFLGTRRRAFFEFLFSLYRFLKGLSPSAVHIITMDVSRSKLFESWCEPV